MAELPKIDSEGLRLAKAVGASRVSSVVNVSKSGRMTTALTKKHFSVRLPDDQVARLSRATDRAADPYAPTITRIVERGIELALAELADKVA